MGCRWLGNRINTVNGKGSHPELIRSQGIPFFKLFSADVAGGLPAGDSPRKTLAMCLGELVLRNPAPLWGAVLKFGLPEAVHL